MKLTLIFIILCSRLFAASNGLRGLVTDAHGLPVAGASVYLDMKGDTEVTVSDLQGRYAFAAIADGAYQLQAWSATDASTTLQVLLSGGASRDQNLLLSGENRCIPMTMRISPLNSPENNVASYRFDIDTESADPAKPLDDAQVEAVLVSMKAGEYQVVMTRPGSAYVGTVAVLNTTTTQGLETRLVDTGGMEIAGGDYIQALSDQASLGHATFTRL
jgi:hypothetical protein